MQIRESRGEAEFRISEGNPREKGDAAPEIVREFALECFLSSDKIIPCGTLRVIASLKGVYRRLWERIFIVLVTNAVRVFLAAFGILVIIQLLMTRHLTTMASYARELDVHKLDSHLALDRRVSKSSQPDELEQVVTAINDMQSRMRVDIAKRERAEEALRESEEKFRSLAENNQDYIMRYDQECRHLYENPAALQVSGLGEEDIIGKTHREAGFDEELCELWEEKITRVLKTGESSQSIFEWEGAEGKVYLDWRLFPEFDKDGTVKTVLGIARDITEYKQAEEEIRKLNAELEQPIRRKKNEKT